MATDPFSCFLCGAQRIGNGDCESVNCSSNQGKFYVGTKSTGEQEIFSPPLIGKPYIDILGPYNTKEEASANLKSK